MKAEDDGWEKVDGHSNEDIRSIDVGDTLRVKYDSVRSENIQVRELEAIESDIDGSPLSGMYTLICKSEKGNVRELHISTPGGEPGGFSIISSVHNYDRNYGVEDSRNMGVIRSIERPQS